MAKCVDTTQISREIESVIKGTEFFMEINSIFQNNISEGIVKITTNKQKITLQTKQRITYDTEPKEGDNISFIINENNLIVNFEKDDGSIQSFKVEFSNIKIKTFAEIIGKVDYVEVNFRKVIIKTDQIVFEISKGGFGGFTTYDNEDDLIGEKIAYWTKKKNMKIVLVCTSFMINIGKKFSRFDTLVIIIAMKVITMIQMRTKTFTIQKNFILMAIVVIQMI